MITLPLHIYRAGTPGTVSVVFKNENCWLMKRPRGRPEKRGIDIDSFILVAGVSPFGASQHPGIRQPAQSNRKILPVSCKNFLFKSVDADGDDEIYYLEFLAATLGQREPISENRLADAFDRLDVDNTGYITRGNLHKFLGDEYSDRHLERILAEGDSNGDGKISFKEFKENVGRPLSTA